jgi:hypothetical protein
MKKVVLIIMIILFAGSIYSQDNSMYKTGITAKENLDAIGRLAPNSVGGVGIDIRYEGVKGSPRLFDTLMPSMLVVKGQDYNIQLESNLDLVQNLLIFNHPKTGKLQSVAPALIKEVRFTEEGKELLFRVTKAADFERDVKDGRFYQVLREGRLAFIKIPFKRFTEADYKAVYSPDRRFDEYTTYYKYYVMAADSTYHQIQLNKKSLIRVLPELKSEINNFDSESYKDNEALILNILDRIALR